MKAHEKNGNLFYFSLSEKDSLHLDPFNAPVKVWEEFPLRVFSVTLPGHEEGKDPLHAMEEWASIIREGKNFLDPFLHEVEKKVREHNITQFAVAGLSRGAFAAAHVAAKFPGVTHLLGFAPLTDLGYLKEFEGVPTEDLKLIHLHLKCKIRFYMSNHDTRVGTRSCFDCIEAFSKNNRDVEMIISPPIGHKGHGTSPTTFREGALWLASSLL